MITVSGIDHIVLRTAKISATLAFYRDTLGLPVERTLEPIGLYQLRAGNALLDIFDTTVYTVAPAGPGESLYDHFCLAIEESEADRVIAHLDRHGVVHGEVSERYGATGNGPSIYATDPDGRTVELKLSPPRA